jgi:hypothetical protein
MRLDKSQRNEIFKAIAAARLDPRDFALDNDHDSDAEARISHRRSESYFTLERDGLSYSMREVVGDRLPWPYPHEEHAWSGVQKRLRRWLDEVKDDIEMPDLWAELQREREMLGAPPAADVDNKPFTADEQAEIAKELREIKEYAKKTYALSEGQTLAFEAKLNYLEEAAGRLGRLDWRAAALGTLFTLVAEAILPPEAVRHILLMLFQPLGHLFGHPIPELPIGW